MRRVCEHGEPPPTRLHPVMPTFWSSQISVQKIDRLQILPSTVGVPAERKDNRVLSTANYFTVVLSQNKKAAGPIRWD